jgi:hypothetical protein
MSRKRIVVSLLLLVALSLGAACYLQLTRTTGNTVAIATPAVPAPTTTESAPPVGGLEPGEALHLAAILGRGSAPAVIPVPTAEQAIAEDPTLEVSTVTMETVDMPTQSIVLASAADSGEYQPRSTYARAGSFRLSGAGGGAVRGGSGTPDQQPSDSSNTSDSNSPGSNASGSGEPEGKGPAGDTQEGSASDETPPNSDTKDPDESTPPKKDEDPKDTQPPSVTEPDDGSPGEPPYEGPGDTPEEKPVSVPEPSTMALLGAGLAALGLVRRRRTPR